MRKKHDDNVVLLADLKALNTDERTREKYDAFLRAIEQANYESTLDNSVLLREGIIPGIGAIDWPELVRDTQAAPVAPVKPSRELKLSWFDFPRLDGSTTAQPLSTLIACRMLGMGAQWYIRRIRDYRNSDGTSERILIPSLRAPDQPARPETTNGYFIGRVPVFLGVHVEMVHTGTGSAYTNLTDGNADIIIVARPPSPDETAYAQKKQVAFDLRPIGYDAFVFLLNATNPMKSLTVKQVQDIYTDRVINWSEIGGGNAPIVAFQRERNSGSQETMERVVMKRLEMAPPLDQVIGYGMGGPYNRMGETAGGISYTFYYYHTVQSPESPAYLASFGGKPATKVCAVDGVLPAPETIRNRTYPFVTEVYAVVRKDAPEESSAVRLRNWLLTPEGQALVKESGYVPLPE
jgi:phosphate transport system substrate-binding protein